MRLAAALGAGTALALALVAPAAAADLAATGWWWRAQGDGPVVLPAPPTVPEGGLLVQGAPSGALAVGAVRFTVDADTAEAVLTIRVADGGGQGLADGVVLACPATAPWAGGAAQAWSQQPAVDCTAPAVGDVSDDGATVTFALGAFGAGEDADLVLVPATVDGSDFDGSNGASFSLTTVAPAATDLATPPSPPPPGATPPEPTTGSIPDLVVPVTPVPARPPRVAAALPTTTTPTTATTAPGGEDEPGDEGAGEEALPPVTLPVLDPFGAGDGPSPGELVPMFAILALGPAALLAGRHPRVAAVLGGDAPSLHAEVGAPAAVDGVDPGERALLLECRDVTVRFGGLDALRGVDLEVHEGEIVGLIGPNGAGKTTLMECISGFQRVTGGTIRLHDEDLLARGPGERAALGIGRTLQNVRLFPYLTIVDNVRVALHRHQQVGTLGHGFRLPSAQQEERELLAEAERIVELVGMQAFAEKFASELSYGTLRLLELACMLALKPTFLLLDEPASGISQKETEALGPLLRRIQAATGATILMIEHDMPLVMSLSDRVYCLDAGAVLSSGTPEEVQADPRVLEAYLGTPAEQRKVAIAPSRPEDTSADVLLEVEGLDVFYDKVQVLYDVDFRVRRGERVALLGTNGAGKSTILKAASGLVVPSAGSVRWKGQDIGDLPAEKRMRLGLGQVPGGRGLFPTLSVGENLRMGGYVYAEADRVEAEVGRVTSYFPWIAERADQPAGTLSGGEQQQLATARALMSRPELLMIDELSLGLAPLVIERLMDTVQRLCEEEGLTVVIVEQQASFALGYTDRAYFMEKGEVRYEGPSAGLLERGDLLRSVFLAGASAGFADEGGRRA